MPSLTRIANVDLSVDVSSLGAEMQSITTADRKARAKPKSLPASPSASTAGRCAGPKPSRAIRVKTRSAVWPC